MTLNVVITVHCYHVIIFIFFKLSEFSVEEMHFDVGLGLSGRRNVSQPSRLPMHRQLYKLYLRWYQRYAVIYNAVARRVYRKGICG